ncbi:Vegetative incompatibility protein HET-E-1 [Verticillium dahliae VDG2]|nr:Vegetative incompatibility protein HET-E-1 [Verticillium dahliae VDG2]
MDAATSHSSGASPALSKGPNPLSSKATAILSTSYADSEFREALALLDEKQINNQPRVRRQVRLDLQKEMIECNGEIINDFGRVADQLRRVRHTLNQLNETYDEMRGPIATSHTQTAPVLQDAALLIQQREDVATKQQLLAAFCGHFLFTNDEIATLTSSAEPVNEDFFAALARAKKISSDCEALLGFENQNLGLEIMEQTSKNLNLAFQKLYKWVQKEFKTLNLENPQLNVSIRRAIRVLSERPSLFQGCLDYFADARHRILSDAFHTALTGTSSTGQHDNTVKPIEMAAHDPLRYVGDMLAWVHSATVGEREALETLFMADVDEIAKGLQTGRATEIWQLIDNTEDSDIQAFDGLKALNELVDRDVSAVARILRQRVEQVIQSNEDTILSYKLANLLGFYRFTFAKLLGDASGLLELLTGLETEALRQFRSLVRDHIARLQGDFQQTPSDLGPPEFLLNALEQLKTIMQTYETSMTGSTDRESDFQPILAESFEPFIAGCESMARGAGSLQGAIFIVNCLMAAKSSLQPFDFTRKRVRLLEERVGEESKTLLASQYQFLRHASGLEEMISALENLTADAQGVQKLRLLEPMQPDALRRASLALDDFLPSALIDAADQVQHVQDPNLAREVTEKAASSDGSDAGESSPYKTEWKNRKKAILKNLPPGVDEGAAKQILNEIVVKGDEVHWSDVAGLEIAKNALREAVVYPFLRPDLFMGLREPARGMLLFGPPGTGKTMLARAVATESRSTFFSISASSLTSKYLGESEKLVRALFSLAKELAPSIIFVDEIDSLLSQRSGSGEHEATRRIKTEFLIQWSDLQRAAAGRAPDELDKSRGDANRVLVLAATNLPWAIDEAARRRFVRRQYIPLPEPETRSTQLRTLLSQQKHGLSDYDVEELVTLTDGFSGSDITALAKDAAMGPLRSLGEALLHMTMDDIRPISIVDFKASLTNIRPSVSKTGLKEYEDWAQEFGERGG